MQEEQEEQQEKMGGCLEFQDKSLEEADVWSVDYCHLEVNCHLPPIGLFLL